MPTIYSNIICLPSQMLAFNEVLRTDNDLDKRKAEITKRENRGETSDELRMMKKQWDIDFEANETFMARIDAAGPVSGSSSMQDFPPSPKGLRCAQELHFAPSCQLTDPLPIHVCGACQKTYPETRLKACAQCKLVRYCGSVCQQSDWKRHKSACKAASCNKQP